MVQIQIESLSLNVAQQTLRITALGSVKSEENLELGIAGGKFKPTNSRSQAVVFGTGTNKAGMSPAWVHGETLDFIFFLFICHFGFDILASQGLVYLVCTNFSYVIFRCQKSKRTKMYKTKNSGAGSGLQWIKGVGA